MMFLGQATGEDLRHVQEAGGQIKEKKI